MLKQMEQDILSKEAYQDAELVAALREWRGADKFWKQVQRQLDASTQIETEAEGSIA